MHSELKFDGQVAVVTGAGRGIGRAHARDLARRGAAVVVNDVAGAEEVVAEITADGGRAVACAESVMTPEGGAAIVQHALDSFGTVDIVINNAGFLRSGYFEDLTVEGIRGVLDVHLLGSFWVTHPAWRVMKEKGYGRVVMTSSNSGMLGHQGGANYSAAKAGMWGLTRALAYEGREHGITVNMLVPGSETRMNEHEPIPDFEKVMPDLTPLRGRLSPDLVAAMVTYLVSSECAVTGEAYTAMAGQYGTYFLAASEGWVAPDPDCVTAEDIREHFGEIRDRSRFSTPQWVPDEVLEMIERLRELELVSPHLMRRSQCLS